MQHSSSYANNLQPIAFFTQFKSSSHLGMSNISANNGGNLIFVQFVRSQSKCVQCLAPRPVIKKYLFHFFIFIVIC